MSSKVLLNVSDILQLANWVEKHKLNKNHPVEIEVSHSSGIGPVIHAACWLENKEGIMLDLTDMDRW